jgi:hypothetical protein
MNPFLVHFIERTGTPKNGAGGAELVDDRGPRGGGEPLGQTVKKLEKIENSQEMCTETYHIFDSNATPPVQSDATTKLFRFDGRRGGHMSNFHCFSRV